MNTTVAWTDELKAAAIEQYLKAEPTAENSAEIVAEIAEDMGRTPNSVRAILSRAKVYVTTSPKKAEGSSKEPKSGDAPKRISKEHSIGELKRLLEEGNFSVDEDILNKLTGKAAIYFADILRKVV